MSEAEAPKDVLLRLAHELCRCYAADDWDDTNPTFEDILTSMVLVAQQPVRAKLDAARAELAQHAALVALTQQLIRNAIAPAQPMTFRDTPLTMVLVLESDLHALTEACAALVTDGGPS